MTVTEKKLIKDLGNRILSEANDLKRTVGALANDIGMDKNYNFDCNLKCNFPPLYPDNIESSSCGELEPEKKYKVSAYY